MKYMENTTKQVRMDDRGSTVYNNILKTIDDYIIKS